MQRDLRHGRPSALEAHAGAVIRFRQVLLVEKSRNTLLYAILFSMKQHVQSQLVCPS